MQGTRGAALSHSGAKCKHVSFLQLAYILAASLDRVYIDLVGFFPYVVQYIPVAVLQITLCLTAIHVTLCLLCTRGTRQAMCSLKLPQWHSAQPWSAAGLL